MNGPRHYRAAYMLLSILSFSFGCRSAANRQIPEDTNDTLFEATDDSHIYQQETETAHFDSGKPIPVEDTELVDSDRDGIETETSIDPADTAIPWDTSIGSASPGDTDTNRDSKPTFDSSSSTDNTSINATDSALDTDSTLSSEANESPQETATTTGTDDAQNTEGATTDTDVLPSVPSDTETHIDTDTLSQHVDNSDIERSTDTEMSDAIDSDTCRESDTVINIDNIGDNADCAGWFDKDHNLCWEYPVRDNRLNFRALEGHCAELGVGWRVPRISELRMLIKDCPTTEYRLNYNSQEECTVDDYSDNDGSTRHCGGCEMARGPQQDGCYIDEILDDILCFNYDSVNDLKPHYWSSSHFESGAHTRIWTVRYDTAGIQLIADVSGAQYHVRCVNALD